MKNRIVNVVCFKPLPKTENTPGWTYLANSTPVGALTCSTHCTHVAARRHATTGRVDTPNMRARA